jgi:hypothetical protein
MEISTLMLFNSIAERIGLRKKLCAAFQKDADAILTCAYYVLSEGNALSGCEQWSACVLNPVGGRFGDQRVSELLRRLTRDRQIIFFREWVRTISEEDNILRST